MSNPEDRAILESIFNPLLPLGECPPDDDVEDGDEMGADALTPEELRCVALERAAIAESETGSLQKALELLDEAVSLAPERASGYNNRAQVHRLLGDTSSAMSDLDSAISVSCGRGLACRQAHAQRGALLRQAAREEDALKDWELAASMGSKFAKSQLVKANPYAAMCNQMLGEMMAKLKLLFMPKENITWLEFTADSDYTAYCVMLPCQLSHKSQSVQVYRRVRGYAMVEPTLARLNAQLALISLTLFAVASLSALQADGVVIRLVSAKQIPLEERIRNKREPVDVFLIEGDPNKALELVVMDDADEQEPVDQNTFQQGPFYQEPPQEAFNSYSEPTSHIQHVPHVHDNQKSHFEQFSQTSQNFDHVQQPKIEQNNNNLQNHNVQHQTNFQGSSNVEQFPNSQQSPNVQQFRNLEMSQNSENNNNNANQNSGNVQKPLRVQDIKNFGLAPSEHVSQNNPQNVEQFQVSQTVQQPTVQTIFAQPAQEIQTQNVQQNWQPHNVQQNEGHQQNVQTQNVQQHNQKSVNNDIQTNVQNVYHNNQPVQQQNIAQPQIHVADTSKQNIFVQENQQKNEQNRQSQIAQQQGNVVQSQNVQNVIEQVAPQVQNFAIQQKNLEHVQQHQNVQQNVQEIHANHNQQQVQQQSSMDQIIPAATQPIGQTVNFADIANPVGNNLPFNPVPPQPVPANLEPENRNEPFSSLSWLWGSKNQDKNDQTQPVPPTEPVVQKQPFEVEVVQHPADVQQMSVSIHDNGGQNVQPVYHQNEGVFNQDLSHNQNKVLNEDFVVQDDPTNQQQVIKFELLQEPLILQKTENVHHEQVFQQMQSVQSPQVVQETFQQDVPNVQQDFIVQQPSNNVQDYSVVEQPQNSLPQNNYQHPLDHQIPFVQPANVVDYEPSGQQTYAQTPLVQPESVHQQAPIVQQPSYQHTPVQQPSFLQQFPVVHETHAVQQQTVQQPVQQEPMSGGESRVYAAVVGPGRSEVAPHRDGVEHKLHSQNTQLERLLLNNQEHDNMAPPVKTQEGPILDTRIVDSLLGVKDSSSGANGIGSDVAPGKPPVTFGPSLSIKLAMDLSELLSMLPAHRFIPLLLDYLSRDAGVAKLIEFAKTPSARNLLSNLDRTPQFQQLVIYLHEKGFPAVQFVNVLHTLLGVPGIPAPPEIPQLTGGVRGLASDALAMVPMDKFQEMLQDKMRSNPELNEIVTLVRGTMIPGILNELSGTREYQEFQSIANLGGLFFF